MPYDIVIASTYSLKLNPAVRNRLTVLANQASAIGKSIAVVSIDDERLDELCSSVNHVLLNMDQKKSSNFLKRALSEFYISFKVLRAAKKLKGMTTVVSIPSVMALPASYLVWMPNLIFDLRDIVWEYLPSKSFLQKTYKYILKKICLYRLRLAKNIVCTNSDEFDYLKSSGIDVSRIYIASNGISQKRFDSLSSLPTRKVQSASTVITYAGNLGVAQNILFFVDEAKRNPNFEFRIYGDGIQKAVITRKIESENIRNCKLFGLVDWEKLLEVYSESDILFAQITSRFKLAVPSKIYEYLATGKEIVFGCEGAARKVADGIIGVKYFTPNSSVSFERALLELKERKKDPDRERAQRISLARNYIRELSIGELLTSGLFDENF